MNTLIKFLTLLVVLLMSGCATHLSRQDRIAEEQRICETVLLRDLEQRDTNRVMFVAILRTDGSRIDPTDELMARLREAGIVVHKASESTMDERHIIVEKVTGKLGIVYYAGVSRWRSNSKVQVISGHEVGFLGGVCIEFIMQKEDGFWVRKNTISRMVM